METLAPGIFRESSILFRPKAERPEKIWGCLVSRVDLCVVGVTGVPGGLRGVR